MNLKDELHSKADAWVEKTGLSHCRLATLAISDGKFFRRLAKGGGVTIRTAERIIEWIEGPGAEIQPRSANDRRTLLYRQRRERELQQNDA